MPAFLGITEFFQCLNYFKAMGGAFMNYDKTFDITFQKATHENGSNLRPGLKFPQVTNETIFRSNFRFKYELSNPHKNTKQKLLTCYKILRYVRPQLEKQPSCTLPFLCSYHICS